MTIGNKCLLDTSVIIELFRNNIDTAVVLDSMQEVYVPVTVIGELNYGAYKSINTQKHLAQIVAFLKNCKIVLTDAKTAEVYGITKATLSKKGKPIPENDIWIAAVAIQYGLPLFARDLHFKEIENLNLF